MATALGGTPVDEDLVDYDLNSDGEEAAVSLEDVADRMETEASAGPGHLEESQDAASSGRGQMQVSSDDAKEAQLRQGDSRVSGDLRDVIELAKQRASQKSAQDLDQVVEEAKGGRAMNKGRKRQRAERLDPSKFIKAASTRLQEPKLGLLWRALKVLGLEAMQQLLIEVEAIEIAGGQLTADGSRRRSPGGVFWNVVKQRVKPEVYTTIFAEEQAKSKQRKRGKPSKKRKQQEAGGVRLEGLDPEAEAAAVDFKNLVEPEEDKR